MNHLRLRNLNDFNVNVIANMRTFLPGLSNLDELVIVIVPRIRQFRLHFLTVFGLCSRGE